jgi:4-hydroxybenzoyl-CoA reductase subunit beta
MLPLPDLQVEVPRSLEDALTILARAAVEGRRARVLAGGTDLVPNLKRGQEAPALLVSLAALRGLDDVREASDGSGALHVGALTRLARVAEHPLVRARAAVLGRAAALIASPQIREMATIGGNLCLDTRCRHVNQTEFWRDALGNCIKAPGSNVAAPCHVVPGGRRCVASASADLPPVLVALGARVTIVSASGSHTIDLSALYRNDGIAPLTLDVGELITEVIVPASAWRVAYQKLRARQAIDFPVLGVAVAVDADEAGTCRALRVVATGVTPAPRAVAKLDAVAVGKRLDRDVVAAIGARCREGLHPLSTFGDDTEWRRDMIPVLVRRALAELGFGDAPGVPA